ncbi:hypothetical protein VOLCADRAFT_62003 [Volvox carteri f. nagariensis]|uniref:Alpha-1,3-glucosyltransferase n=1 Tax=Volvox carteri f. nagariensis TaxID=3068 RepID=D8U029_VOLCA|nr:uncharacterized protein VOLCADRAFT_62003 [Volvox carteri f. nagariensis]EFJ46865.1 hypothetical protein VOLCADRAFT_62003 [Volvox carteri f. nagariensis]|eukprot:XP_002952074.1 hypothetical protein VOLCADRAFT_62003 [Volvox carteri f. nagariensis]
MLNLLDFVGDDRLSTAVVVLLAILVRVLTGLASYSGAGDAPKYGDYEAQRHWMELTVNLPVTEWYTDSPVNNASYWPLDYPPLSGYQSWLCGKVLRAVEPASVELVRSHGYETPSSKIAMRWTVIAADLLVYIPACLAAIHVFYGAPSSPSAGSSSATAHRARTLALLALLFSPAAIIIDHGHFQYNNISLGLTLAAAAAIGSGRQLLGAALFSAALNHKQMALFFAPGFFAHLLGWALHSERHRGVLAVAKLGLVVIATFAACWAPYLSSKGAVLQVLTRIFPVRRGLYEDYVANWWCASSLLIKWKSRFSAPVLLRAAAAATLAAAAPSMAHQILGRPRGGGGGPSRWGFLRCLANSAFAFYMFSYQVHEKSILLPLLPVTLLAGREPSLATWLPLLAALSMFPLLDRDGVALPYVALCALYGAVMAGPALHHARQLQRLQVRRHDDTHTSQDGGAGMCICVCAQHYTLQPSTKPLFLFLRYNYSSLEM